MRSLDTQIVIRLIENGLRENETAAIRYQSVGIGAMVLWEIEIGLENPAVAAFVSSCHIGPIDVATALASNRLDFRSDPADEIIAATSVVHGVPLLTRDERLQASKVVPLLKLPPFEERGKRSQLP